MIVIRGALDFGFGPTAASTRIGLLQGKITSDGRKQPASLLNG
jgi:hypothetical protein